MRWVASSVAAASLALLPAAGCGGSSSGLSTGGGGSSGTTNGGDGGSNTGKGGKPSTGSAGTDSTAGAAGEGPLPPAQNHSAVSFVGAGAVSSGKQFILIGSVGETLGGTVSSKRAESEKYILIPGVIAATSP